MESEIETSISVSIPLPPSLSRQPQTTKLPPRHSSPSPCLHHRRTLNHNRSSSRSPELAVFTRSSSPWPQAPRRRRVALQQPLPNHHRTDLLRQLSTAHRPPG